MELRCRLPAMLRLEWQPLPGNTFDDICEPGGLVLRARVAHASSEHLLKHMLTISFGQESAERRDLTHLDAVGIQSCHHEAKTAHVARRDQPLPAIEVAHMWLTACIAAQLPQVAPDRWRPLRESLRRQLLNQ